MRVVTYKPEASKTEDAEYSYLRVYAEDGVGYLEVRQEDGLIILTSGLGQDVVIHPEGRNRILIEVVRR